MRTAAVLAALLIYPTFGFQSPNLIWRKSAIERPGLHHANIRGRLIGPDTKPVRGVRVQLNTGTFRDLPSAETISDQEGRFEFIDVNSATRPTVTWQSADWLRGSMTVPGESGEDISVGEIRLEPDTLIWVSLELVGGTALGEASRKPSVVLANAGGQGPRIVAEQSDGLYILRQIPFTDGIWDISLFANGHAESFSGKFHVERGSRDQFLTLRLLRDTVRRVNERSYQGKLEVSEALVPEQSPDKAFQAKGTLRSSDGSPISGAIISINDFILHRSTPSWTFSSADGTFDLRYFASGCMAPQVDFAVRRLNAWTPEPHAAAKDSCANAWSQPRDLTVSSATHLFLKPTGTSIPQSIRAFWWHPSMGWRSFATLDPWISLGIFDNKFAVKLEADGYLPVIRNLELPNVNTRKGEKPPERLDETFAFDATASRELHVTTAGKSAASATVDLEWIEDLRTAKRIPLATYHTGPDGKLRLIGSPPRQLVEVFVYAKGFEPRRAIWNADGEPLTLDLAPRQSRLTFSQLRPGQVVRMHTIGQPEAVRTLRCDYGEPPELLVAAGTYEIVIYSEAGQVLSYQRTTLAAGEARTIEAKSDRQGDQRPTLTIHYPEEGWTASVTPSTPGGMPFGWAIYSTIGGGQAPITDLVGVLESESPQQAVFRLSRAGRVHVQLSRAGQQIAIWREIETSPGQALSLTAPKLDATLQGSMRTYDGGKGFSEHGWAGPRMQMIADDPSAWSVTVFMPPRDGEHSFTLRSLPAGEYHLYQHLIGKPQSYKDDKGVEHPYSIPLDAWGGIAVKLSPGAATRLDDFIEYPFRDVPVVVADSEGRPVRNATVRVRDRMSDAWRQVAEGPTTLSYAAHPIPYPPAVRLDGGKATLPSIRNGRLELQVELDDGRVFRFTVNIDATTPLQLKLPSEGAARQ